MHEGRVLITLALQQTRGRQVPSLVAEKGDVLNDTNVVILVLKPHVVEARNDIGDRKG